MAESNQPFTPSANSSSSHSASGYKVSPPPPPPFPQPQTNPRPSLDAVSFPDFHCFASNQTGNTVFLVLAIVLPEMNGEMFVTANIGVALGFFLAAAWLTGQLGHIIGPRRRLYLLVCNAVQTALVFAAAAVQYAQHASTPGGELHLAGPRTLVAIGLLASAAGSQVVLSRALAMTEITTAMATAAWVDLVIDPGLVRGLTKNRPRNRRVAFLTALVLGTLAGAFIYKRVGSPAALVVSGAGKALVTGMFFWSPQEEEGDGGVEGGKGGVVEGGETGGVEKGREGV